MALGTGMRRSPSGACRMGENGFNGWVNPLGRVLMSPRLRVLSHLDAVLLYHHRLATEAKRASATCDPTLSAPESELIVAGSSRDAYQLKQVARSA